jgi:hypothetical protein
MHAENSPELAWKKTFVFSKEKLLAGGAIYYAAAPIYLPFPSGNVKKVRVVGERALTDWWLELAGMRGRKVGAIESQASSRHQQ